MSEGCLQVSVSLLNEPLDVSVSLLNEALQVSCSLICSSYITPLLVLPKEKIQWITLESPVVYTVITRKEWKVK